MKSKSLLRVLRLQRLLRAWKLIQMVREDTKVKELVLATRNCFLLKLNSIYKNDRMFAKGSKDINKVKKSC